MKNARRARSERAVCGCDAAGLPRPTSLCPGRIPHKAREERAGGLLPGWPTHRSTKQARAEKARAERPHRADCLTSQWGGGLRWETKEQRDEKEQGKKNTSCHLGRIQPTSTHQTLHTHNARDNAEAPPKQNDPQQVGGNVDARVTPRAGGSRCAANPSRGGRAAHTQLTRASPWLPPRSLSRTDHKQDTQPRRTNPAGRACTGAPSGRESTAATDGNARRHRKHLRGGTCGRRLSRGGEGETRGAGGRGRPRHTHTKEYEQNHIEKNGGRSDASGKGGGGGHQPQAAAAMRVTEAGGAQLLAWRAGQRQSGTFTQQHRPRVHAAIDTTNAGTATTKPRQAQPPPEMTATTPADAGRHRRRRAGRKPARRTTARQRCTARRAVDQSIASRTAPWPRGSPPPAVRRPHPHRHNRICQTIGSRTTKRRRPRQLGTSPSAPVPPGADGAPVTTTTSKGGTRRPLARGGQVAAPIEKGGRRRPRPRAERHGDAAHG